MSLITFLKSVSEEVDRVVGIVCAAIMGLIVLVVLLEVWVRFLNIGGMFFWTEELGIYLMIFCSFIGVSVTLKKGHLVSVTLITGRISGSTRRFLEILVTLISLICVAYLTWYGWESAYENRDFFSYSLNIPVMWPMLTVPIGGAFMLLHLILKLISLMCPQGN